MCGPELPASPSTRDILPFWAGSRGEDRSQAMAADHESVHWGIGSESELSTEQVAVSE